MDMQNVSNLQIPEGAVRTIHDKYNRLLWGRVAYNTKYVGNIIQDGTPTPDAPIQVQAVTGEQTVKVTGKNLLDLTLNSSSGSPSNRMRLDSISSDSINLTVLASNNYSAWVLLFNYSSFGLNAGDILTLDCDALASEAGPDPSIRVSKGSSGAGADIITNWRKSTGPTTFELPSDVDSFSLWFYANQGSPAPSVGTTVTFSNIQLEKGPTATDYEPYQVQSYLIDLQGKNLLDQNTLVAGYVSSNGTFSTAQTQAEMRSGFIWVQPNTTYTFSIQETTDAYPAWFGVGLYSADSTSSFIRRDTNTATTATSITFTTSATTNYVVVSARNMVNATKAQLEEGSTVTEYVEFNKIELCKIGDYQDYIYKIGDDWYVHKETDKVILAGSLFTRANSLIKTYQIDKTALNQLLLPAGTTNIKSDYFHCVTDGTPAIGEVYSGNSYLNFNYDNVGDGSGLPTFRAWVDANKPMLYGLLATPTDTQITDSTLIGQLDSVHQWLARYGYNATVTGDLPIVIDKTNL